MQKEKLHVCYPFSNFRLSAWNHRIDNQSSPLGRFYDPSLGHEPRTNHWERNIMPARLPWMTTESMLKLNATRYEVHSSLGVHGQNEVLK